MQSFSSDDLDISYKYNSLGQRIRKTVGSTKHEYFYGGTRLEKEVRTELDGTIHTLVFLYDASDSPIGMQYDGTAYYYKKNLQGDVIALLDATCNTVAEYIYDAWGALRIIKASTANTTIAEANPIRYRGYYYDNETGFYFLQSRYYDPVIGRFINADDAVFLNKSNVVSSCNLFSYCNNNPMRYIDPFGFWSESWGIFDEQQANDFALYLDDLRRDNDAEYYDPIAELSFGSFIEFCANKIAEKLAVESSTLAFLPGAVSIAIATLTITTTLKSVIELKALDEYDLVANAVRKAIKQSKSKKLILFFLNGYKTVEIKIADNANGYVYSIIMLTATNLGPYIEFAEKVNVTLYEREVGNDYSYPEM